MASTHFLRNIRGIISNICFITSDASFMVVKCFNIFSNLLFIRINLFSVCVNTILCCGNSIALLVQLFPNCAKFLSYIRFIRFFVI